jgi:arginyl-tRNA synthetase
VITAELRRAILAAAGADPQDCDPLLRPGPAPGSYASSIPFRLAPNNPRGLAATLAARMQTEPWIASAQVTGPGYLTITVTRQALADLAVRIPQAGPACATSDALHGRRVPAPPEPDLAAAPGWPQAHAALAAHLTARLAAAAGATLFFSSERTVVLPPEAHHARPPALKAPVRSDQNKKAEPSASAQPPTAGAVPEPTATVRGARSAVSGAREPSVGERGARPPAPGGVAWAIEYAGEDAVRFALARTAPGESAPEAASLARHVLANPAYAVRYAHAAAAAVLRWAGGVVPPGMNTAEGSGETNTAGPAGFQPRLLAEPRELALLDALSWLPERVAMAARRGRPDDFARYLEGLAARTMDTMSTTGFRKVSSISSERLWLADAARTGLAAGLGLLGVGAPDRL